MNTSTLYSSFPSLYSISGIVMSGSFPLIISLKMYNTALYFIITYLVTTFTDSLLREQLCKWVGKFFCRVIPPDAQNTRCCYLMHSVVVDQIVLLGKGGCRDACVLHNPIAITEYIRWPSQGKPKHFQLDFDLQDPHNPQRN